MADTAVVNSVLFVDDEETSTKRLIRSLEHRGVEFKMTHTTSASQALKIQQEIKPIVAVVDLCLDPETGPESGFKLIEKLQKIDSLLRVLVLTGHGSDHYGIKALHSGAASFLVKPVNLDHLLALINDSIAYVQLKKRYQQITNSNLFETMGISTANPQMAEVLKEAAFAASNRQSVLILGETGTGKGLLARAIHKKSARRNRNFVRFQPSFGSADLVSSELFGHTKGAFTGAFGTRKGLIEEANRGTLFIDEVGDLPIQTQIMLLEVLQENNFRKVGSNIEQNVDLRLITATNKNIEECIKKETIRTDFLHRIRHLQITLIPLRERKEDINNLTKNFIDSLAEKEDLSIHTISDPALGLLRQHTWPGNIRELRAVVENACYRATFANRHYIDIEDIEIIDANQKEAITIKGSLREQVRVFENQLAKQALEMTNNNQSKAANLLQIDRSSFRRILSRLK